MAVFFFLFVFIPNKAWHIARKNSRFVSLERGFERKRSCVLPLGTTARQSRGLRPREKRQAARGPGRLPVRGRAAARPARGGGSGHFLLPPRTSRRVAPAADRPPAPCPPHARSEAARRLLRSPLRIGLALSAGGPPGAVTFVRDTKGFRLGTRSVLRKRSSRARCQGASGKPAGGPPPA